MTHFTIPDRSLAAAVPGERFQIKRIHFGLVRERCSELGIREGEVLRCVRNTAKEVVVEFPQRHTTALEMHYARFVELRDADAGGLDLGPSNGRRVRGARRPELMGRRAV